MLLSLHFRKEAVDQLTDTVNIQRQISVIMSQNDQSLDFLEPLVLSSFTAAFSDRTKRFNPKTQTLSESAYSSQLYAHEHITLMTFFFDVTKNWGKISTQPQY